MPPDVTTRGHGDVGAGALENEAVLDVGALPKGVIDNLLCANQLAATLALVGCDDDLGPGIDDAVAQRVGREAGEDDRVDSADPGAGKEGNDGLGNHGQVDGDCVSLAHAHVLQHVGHLGDLAQELAVGHVAALVGLVGLVDDGDAVGVLEGMAVNAVVRGVELALEEPGNIAAEERAALDCLEVLVPRQQLARQPPPELGGLCDGLLVQLLVFFET